MQKRLEGYVVACDDGAWKVRVKMKESKYDDNKYVVASIKDNMTLVVGLDVTFILGSFKGKTKAMDVTPVTPS